MVLSAPLWADSRFDDQFVADEEQTRRFLRNNLHALNTDGIEKPAEPVAVAATPRDECSAPASNAGLEDDAEEPFYYTDLDDDEEDDDQDDDVLGSLVVAGAVVAAAAVLIVVVKVAPRVKRRWSESRAKRRANRIGSTDGAGEGGTSPVR